MEIVGIDPLFHWNWYRTTILLLISYYHHSLVLISYHWLHSDYYLITILHSNQIHTTDYLWISFNSFYEIILSLLTILTIYEILIWLSIYNMIILSFQNQSMQHVLWNIFYMSSFHTLNMILWLLPDDTSFSSTDSTLSWVFTIVPRMIHIQFMRHDSK